MYTSEGFGCSLSIMSHSQTTDADLVHWQMLTETYLESLLPSARRFVIFGHILRVTNFRRPPSLGPDFGPDEFAVSRLLAHDALIAEPVGVRVRLYGSRETFLVEGGGARVAAEEVAAVGTGKAKPNVDVGGGVGGGGGEGVFVPSRMRGADDIGAAQIPASGRNAEIPRVIGDRTFEAFDQFAGSTSRALRVFEPTLEADVSRAFEGGIVAREF